MIWLAYAAALVFDPQQLWPMKLADNVECKRIFNAANVVHVCKQHLALNSLCISMYTIPLIMPN